MEDVKSHIRDLNLDLLMNQNNLKIDISRRYNTKFRLFYPSRKLIRCIIKNGGVLTGSRAIRCFFLDGKPLLDRDVNDWDFLITLNQAYQIFQEMDFLEIPKIGETISIKNQRMWRHPDYDEAYRVGIVDVQMLIVDDLPDFIDIKGYRLTSLSYCLQQKINLLENLNKKEERTHKPQYFKHIEDLKQIILKYNCIKLMRTK